MKRNISYVYTNTRSKKPKLVNQLFSEDKTNLIAATKVYNYMVGDPLIDWLKLSSNPKIISNNYNSNKNDSFHSYILQKGHQFEKHVIKYINDNIHPVVKVNEYINSESCKKTIELMKLGTPIIHSAPFINNYNKTKGIIDILIRSDFINKISTKEVLSEEEILKSSTKLNNQYHYIVVDIKFSTLPLLSDGKHLQNSDSFKAYKSQLLIYTQGIGHIQGYTAPHAFILGRRQKFTSNGIVNTSFDCLERLGKIDYSKIDKKYIKETKNAINWFHAVQKDGHNWKHNPPSRIELYPNMCKDSGYWNKEKQKIAEEIGEITMIWNLGKKHRNNAISKGITSWYDNNCTTKKLGITGKNANIIDKIININRNNKELLLPKKIKNNKYNWKSKENEIFVDFETMTDIFSDFNNLPIQSNSDMIFMIGIGWVDNNKWNYHSYICNEATYDEEYRIMNEFVEFIKNKNFPKLNYWCAESTMWNKAETRQFDIAHKNNDIERKDNISDNWKIDKWCDLYNIFKEEPIVIKDCFNFGLKSIAKAMKKHNMITAEIESNCNSGKSAMVNAFEYYKNKENNIHIINDIRTYNEFDCKVLYEIINYLREYHT